MSQISLFLPIRPIPPPARGRHMKSHRRLLWLTAVLFALMATLYARADTPAYVLDAGAKTIVRLDVQHGTVEAKTPLPFRDDPTELISAPDGKHLVVLSPGKGRRFSDSFRPDGNASAAIVDTATLSSTPRIDLGRG